MTLVSLSLVTSGCQIFSHKAKPTVTTNEGAALVAASTAVSNANAVANSATAAAAAKVDARDARVKANVTAAKEWNTLNPEGNPKFGVDSELMVALDNFSDVTIDPVEQAAAASRRALIEAGKASEARAAYDKANAQAQGYAAELITAKAAEKDAANTRDAAISAEGKTVETTNAQLAQNQKDNQAQIDKAKKDAIAGVTHQQATWLNILGAAALVAFGVSVWVASMSGNVIAGAKSAWPFAVFSVICFGLAQIVSQPWFVYAVLGSLVVASGLAVWWAVKQHQIALAKTAAEQKAATVASALQHVVPVLDTAYTAATPEVKQVMDTTIFDKLNVNMDAADKATIHDVRSTLASTAALAAPTP